MNITKGKIPSPLKVVLYGVEGIGKSTFASQFPAPLFIDTEGSTKNLDIARFDKPTSWQMLLQEVRYVVQTPNCCKTLVIDTADWAEQLEIADLCARKKWSGIEDPGYGRGYQYSADEFGKLLNLLSEVTERGVHVVMTAHACLRKVELPDELGAFDHWEMKTTKKVAPMIREWADLVLFANYKTYAVKTEAGKVKGQGGERRMYTTHHPCWDAKNRFGLAPELPFQYAEIAGIVDAACASVQPISDSAPQSEPAAVNPPPDPPQTVGDASAPASAETAEPAPPAPVDDFVPDIPDGIPQALADLMRANHVTATDIQTAVSAKGYFPLGMEITDYPREFIDGCLIGAWDQLYQVILQEREKIPFAIN